MIVEDLIANFVSQIESSKQPELVLQSSKHGETKLKLNSRRSWRRIAILLRVLSLAMDSAQQGKGSMTKREVYYMDTNLFRFTQDIDWALDLLATTLELPRDSLGITASTKGMAFGNLRCMTQMDSGDCSCIDFAQTVVHIKSWYDFKPVELPSIVVIVEKEAVFNALWQDRNFLKDAFSEGILFITGKGYPCLATQRFVHLLFKAAPTRRQQPTRFFALVDFDPYGLEIALRYRLGSKLKYDSDTNCPALELLGITRKQLDCYVSHINPNSNVHNLSKRASNTLRRVRSQAQQVGWQELVVCCDELDFAGFCTEIEHIYMQDRSSLVAFILCEIRKMIAK